MKSHLQGEAGARFRLRLRTVTQFLLFRGVFPMLLLLNYLRAADANLAAASSDWVIRSWRTEEGLPQNTVNAILQTRDGFLWVGTSAGLARFDGLSFRRFGLKDGLRSIQIFRLAEDHDGNLWVGTVGGGISRWDHGRFQTFGAAEGMNVGTVQALVADHSGTLWIGGEQGLVKWRDGVFTSISAAEGLPKAPIRALAVDVRGTLWASALSQGLFCERNGRFDPVEGAPPAARSVYSLLAASDGAVWMGSGNGQLWQHHDGKWKQFGAADGLPGGSFESIAQGADGTIWITAQNSSVYRFAAGHYRREGASEMADEKVRVIASDREGSIWAGSVSGGLYRLSKRVLKFWGEANGLGKTSVTSAAEDTNGVLWVTTQDKGVQQLRDGRFMRYREPTNSSVFPNAYTCTTTSDGSVWAAGEQFLFRFRTEHPAESYLAPPIRGEAIRALHPDGSVLWIGTYYSSLLKWESNDLRVVAPSGSFESGITSIARESADTLWIGSSSGLYQWSRGKVRKWTTQGALLSSNVRALHRDPDGTLWVGTLGGGLGRLKNGRMFNITTEHGLIDDVISQIVPDDFGHLWLGCNQGIMQVEREDIDAIAEGRASDLSPLILGRGEGLLREQCVGGHSPTALKTKDGKLLFPTVGGMAEIDPRIFNDGAPVAPRACVDSFAVDAQQQPPLGSARIPPGKHRLEINYTAPLLRGGRWLRFRYKLDGLDQDWVRADARRAAAYEALRPGHYVFRVAVRDARHEWNEAVAPLAFTIAPFYWQTTWFRVVLILLLAGGGAGTAGGIAAFRRRRRDAEFHRAHERSSTLLDLSMHPAVAAGDVPVAFREICEKAAHILEASRVSLWLLDEGAGELRCANVFDAVAKCHKSGQAFPVPQISNYIAGLQKQRVVVARHARLNPQTIEWNSKYFEPLGVTSVLDAAIHLSDRLAGVIRHECTGALRDWKQDEVVFAGEIADQVARALLSAQREQANRNVRESEERFRTLANGAPVMIWMAGADKRCIFVNKGWLQFTGRTMEEELGDGWALGIHPEDLAECIRVYGESFDARREFTMEYRLRKNNGDYAWVLDNGTPRFVADGTFSGYIGTATDITAMKQAQERWRMVVECAPNAMLVVDAHGLVTLVNARGEQVFGYDRDELIGQPIEMLVPDGSRAMRPRRIERYSADSNVRSAGASRELFGRRKDGTSVPLEIGFNPIRTPEGEFVLASMIDITERLAADAKLRESERRMSLAADAAHLGMWVWNAPDTFMWASEKWRSIHGYSPDEDIRYDALLEPVHPEDRAMVERAITNAFNRRSTFHLEHRLLLHGGMARWIAMSGRVEQVAQNGPLRLLGISIDITDRKEAEDAAREVSGKLISAQEDERRRIARELHDDLNQRLALLSVETDLLGRMDHNPEAQPLIEDIASRVKNLSSEVHKLSYQLHPAKLEQLGLVSATRALCQEQSRQWHVAIEFVHDDVSRDLNRNAALCLYRITQEALQNIVKHSRAARARVELRQQGDDLRLVVSDNGQGFDMALAAHHAGLGLVGMRERVRLVHGRISFHSAPGQGTRIEAMVPVSMSEFVV